MTFYQAISQYYDAIFPVMAPALDLQKDLVEKESAHILDIGCGTGGYAKALSQLGHKVLATDLDVSMLNQIDTENYPNLQVQQMDMLKMEETLDTSFDFISLIGNTLVHLSSEEDVYTCLTGIYKHLKPGGKCLIQIINYDRVMAQGINHLPTIKNDTVGLIFKRDYTYDAQQDKIMFKGTLSVGDYQSESTVALLPLKSQILFDQLTKIGFENIQTYGDFKKNIFDIEKSQPLVIVACKA